MAGLHRSFGHLRVALQRHGHREQRDRHRFTFEKVQQAPYTHTRPVLVDRFHAHVPLTRPGLRSHNLRQKRLGRLVTMQDAVFTAFFVVKDELQRESCAPGPVRDRYGGAVACQIAWIVIQSCRHCCHSAGQERRFRSAVSGCSHNRVFKIFSIRRKKCLKSLQAGAVSPATRPGRTSAREKLAWQTSPVQL